MRVALWSGRNSGQAGQLARDLRNRHLGTPSSPPPLRHKCTRQALLVVLWPMAADAASEVSRQVVPFPLRVIDCHPTAALVAWITGSGGWPIARQHVANQILRPHSGQFQHRVDHGLWKPVAGPQAFDQRRVPDAPCPQVIGELPGGMWLVTGHDPLNPRKPWSISSGRLDSTRRIVDCRSTPPPRGQIASCAAGPNPRRCPIAPARPSGPCLWIRVASWLRQLARPSRRFRAGRGCTDES